MKKSFLPYDHCGIRGRGNFAAAMEALYGSQLDGVKFFPVFSDEKISQLQWRNLLDGFLEISLSWKKKIGIKGG